MDINAHLKFGIGGEFKVKLWDQDADGNLTLAYESDWSSNTIVNNGLSLVTTTNNWWSFFILGDDGAAATEADTQLGSYLGGSNTSQGLAQEINLGSPDYQLQGTLTKRFAAGVATGIIREMAVTPTNTNTDIFCRHVISPAVGKAADQVLDVSYRLTLWPPLVDVLGSGTFEGVPYNTTTRVLNVDGPVRVFAQWGPDTFYTHWFCFDGALGAETDAEPQGNQGIGNTPGQWGTDGWEIVNTTYYRDCFVIYPLDNQNLVAGIRTAKMGTAWQREFQTEYSATVGGDPIWKDLTKELTFNYRISWTRH